MEHYEIKDGKVTCDGVVIGYGKALHQWSMPNGTASLSHYATGWSLMVTYFEARTVDRRYGRAGVGRQVVKQKKFVTPVTPLLALSLKNGGAHPNEVTQNYHARMLRPGEQLRR